MSMLEDNACITMNDATEIKINEGNKKLASCSSSSIFKLSKWRSNGIGISKAKNFRMLSNDLGYFFLDGGQIQKYVTAIPVVRAGEIVNENLATSVHERHSYRFVESKRWRGVSVDVHKVDLERLSNASVTEELKSIFQNQLARELRIVSRLQHPHIRSPLALLVDCNFELRVADSSRIGLVYERPSLGSLYHFKQIQLEDLSVLPALTICRQIAEALQFLHSYCMVHCNVTPHSIHLFSIEHAKLGNFEYTVQLSAPVNLSSTVHSSWNKVSSREMSSSKVTSAGAQQPDCKYAQIAASTPTTVFQCACHLPSEDLADWLPPELFAHSNGKSSLLQKRVNLHKPTYVSDVYGLAKVLQFVLPPMEYGPLNGDWDHAAYSVPITNAKMVIEAALQPCPEERLPLKQFHRLLIHLFWNEYDQHTSPRSVVSRPGPCPLRLCDHKLANSPAEHVRSRRVASPTASTPSDWCEPLKQRGLPSDQTELDTHYVTVRKRRALRLQSPSLRSPSDSSVQCLGASWKRHNFFQATSAASPSFATSLSSSEPLSHSDGLTTLPSSVSSSEANTPSQRTKSKTPETVHPISVEAEIEKSRHVTIAQTPVVDGSNSASLLNHSKNFLNRSRSAKLSRADYVHLAAVPLLPEGVDVPKQLAPWRRPSVKRLTRSNTLPSKTTRSLRDWNGAFVNSVTESGASCDSAPMKPASHITYLLRTPPNYAEVTGKPDLIQFSSQRLRRLRRNVTSIALSRSEGKSQNHHDTLETVSQFHKLLHHSTSFSALGKIHVATQTGTTLSHSVQDGAVGDNIHTGLSTSTVSRYELNPVSSFSLVPDTTGERNKLPESMHPHTDNRVFKMVKLFECQPDLSSSHATNNKTPPQNVWTPKLGLKNSSSTMNDTPIIRLVESVAPELHDVQCCQLVDRQKDGVVTHRNSPSTSDFHTLNSDVIDAKPEKPGGSESDSEHNNPTRQLASLVNVQIPPPIDLTTQSEIEVPKPVGHRFQNVQKSLHSREVPDESARTEAKHIKTQPDFWQTVQVLSSSPSTKANIPAKIPACRSQKNGLDPSTLLKHQEPGDLSSFSKPTPLVSPLKSVDESLSFPEQSSDRLQAVRRNPVDQFPPRTPDANRKQSVDEDICLATSYSRFSNDEKYFSFLTIPLWSCAAPDVRFPHTHQNNVVLKHTTDSNCESIFPSTNEENLSGSVVRSKSIPGMYSICRVICSDFESLQGYYTVSARPTASLFVN
ncbi:hypothetical protein P879_05244 [Paragonimus westermani]|uniref:Protein kinase domain-containing protein n=1 Tax=Paragonimus westermani TaxID=34504 RepID=A0A8T0DSJ6_9TREM|nr:hypothetical protein P879_05244 [Paragonimus westermani]